MSRRRIVVGLVCLLLLVATSGALARVDVFFSPRGGCDTAIAHLADSAAMYLDAACYTFTLDAIADSLIRAQSRGVHVRVIVDKGQARQQWSMTGRLPSGAGTAISRSSGKRRTSWGQDMTPSPPSPPPTAMSATRSSAHSLRSSWPGETVRMSAVAAAAADGASSLLATSASATESSTKTQPTVGASPSSTTDFAAEGNGCPSVKETRRGIAGQTTSPST